MRKKKARKYVETKRKREEKQWKRKKKKVEDWEENKDYLLNKLLSSAQIIETRSGWVISVKVKLEEKDYYSLNSLLSSA